MVRRKKAIQYGSVNVIASEAKQSQRLWDCFASLAMTVNIFAYVLNNFPFPFNRTVLKSDRLFKQRSLF
ncbi:hypothetical protein [Calothrix sp. NIES-2100]|uniref:hypothetical protein n=1 Tax=Calothrix sp. NIES-2100 TaxID=1954172 RepID=UPI0030DA422D